MASELGRRRSEVKNQVQLCTYADRLGGTLAGLRELLEGPLAGLFGGVHVLPFFEPIDGADAGFDPIDHTRVDRRLGSWADVAALARITDVMVDVIVNHISSRSPQFLDFVAKGDRSEHAGMFLTLARVFPEGASERDFLAIHRQRPRLPFTPATLADGSARLLWTTFTAEQIDIDVEHARGREYLDDILRVLGANGVTMLRLDAVGYAIKRAGTSCFMLEETVQFIRSFTEQARQRGLEVLVEVHSHYEQQMEIARHVDRVYDFALPPLVLHAFFSGTVRYLRRWIEIRPHNAVTVLDTHDGIGMIDVAGDGRRAGLVPDAELARVAERIHANSRGESARATGAAAANLDVTQVNCTFYDALEGDDLAYLLCRAIQLFLPGVPQVYYVGLLAGGNDMELLSRTGVGRDINRHHYTRGEIDTALERPVVAALCELIRLRNSHAAFSGEFQVAETGGDSELDVGWRNGAHFARLQVNVRSRANRLEYSRDGGSARLELGASDCVNS